MFIENDFSQFVQKLLFSNASTSKNDTVHGDSCTLRKEKRDHCLHT